MGKNFTNTLLFAAWDGNFSDLMKKQVRLNEKRNMSLFCNKHKMLSRLAE